MEAERYYTTTLFPKIAEELDVVCVRFKDTGGRSFNPVPFDNIFIYPQKSHKAVFTETKMEKGKLKDHQLKFAIFCAEKRLKHYVIRIYPSFYLLCKMDITGKEDIKDNFREVKDMILTMEKL